MCGLCGVLLYPSPRSRAAWQAIVDVTGANLVANEERGRDAAGLAVVRSDGSCRIFKQPVAPSQLVQMEGYCEALSNLDEHTLCILGHARAPTKGSRWRNANNHPLLAGHTIGIHNGVIANDDALFAELALPRAGEVDSEIIFRLLDALPSPVGPRGMDGYPARVQQQVERLQGTFATLSVDLRQPAGLLVLKQGQPLCLHYEPELQALFFSSRYAFLRRAFGRSVITEALDPMQGFYFDARCLPGNGSRPLSSFPILNKTNTYTPETHTLPTPTGAAA